MNKTLKRILILIGLIFSVTTTYAATNINYFPRIGLTNSTLFGCDTLDTTATGTIVCGTDGGGSGTFTTTTINGLSTTAYTFTAGTGLSIASSAPGTLTFVNTAPNFNTTTSINGLTGAITGLNIYNTTTSINGMTGAITGLNIYNVTTTLGTAGYLQMATGTANTLVNTDIFQVGSVTGNRIGIGTTTPTSTLHIVSGGGRTGGLTLDEGGGTFWNIYSDNPYLTFNGGGSGLEGIKVTAGALGDILTIDNNGLSVFNTSNGAFTRIDPSQTTGNRTLTAPDASGRIALTSQLTTTTINSVNGPTFFLDSGTGLLISSSSNRFTFTNTAPNFNTTTTIFAGSGISVDSSTGNVTITNTGSAGGSSTLATFTAQSNSAPSSSFATFDTRNDHVVLDYTSTTMQYGIFADIMPQNYVTSTMAQIVTYWTSTSTTGVLVAMADFERIGLGSQDIDTDGYNTSSTASTSVSATSGNTFTITFNLTNANLDAVLAGEPYRLRIGRTKSSVEDTIEDAELNFIKIIQ